MKVTPQQIVDELEIAPGDMLFIKASMNFLGYGPKETLLLLETLLNRLGSEGTLLMPSFPYANHVGRTADGYVFDVKKSPSGMGLLTEMFRRMDRTVRSEQYWVPTCAQGRHADEIVAGQLKVLNPFGEDSCYRRLVDYPVKMVGLGVTTNYNILAHVADAVLFRRYPFEIFDWEPLQGIVIDAAGRRNNSSTITVSQSRRKMMRPSSMIQASERLQKEVRRFTHDGAIIFSLPGQLYFLESLRLGAERLDAGQLPPWLEALEVTIQA